jgi:plastocyanin
LLDRQLLFALCLFVFASAASARDRHSITIVDRNGRVVPSAPTSPNGNTVDVQVGNGGFNFNPSTVNIAVGDTVRWTWFSSGHNVRSGTPCNTPDNAFCSINDTSCTTNPTSSNGTVYSHTFNQAGTFQYYCSVHCAGGMKGSVVVSTPFILITSITDVAGSVTIAGQTLPGLTIHIESSADLVSGFSNPVAVTANGSGGFNYVDATALSARFYRAVYP